MYKLNEDKLIKFLKENQIQHYEVTYPVEGEGLKPRINLQVKCGEYDRVWLIVFGYETKYYLHVCSGACNGEPILYKLKISAKTYEKILSFNSDSVHFELAKTLDKICNKTKDIEEKA